MRRLVVAGLALLLQASFACGSSGGDIASTPVVIRVSATAGMVGFVPGAEAHGSTAAALDLVYDPVTDYAQVERRVANVVWLTPHPDGQFTPSSLARLVKFDGLVGVDVVGDDSMKATFSNDDVAAAFVTVASVTGISTGPFVASTDGPAGKKVTLVRRGSSRIERIEIFPVSKEEEWRLLLGRRLDVVPRAELSQRASVENVDSIRILEIPATHDYALFFNVQRPALATADARRAIAHAIDRMALSQVVCGGSACEVEVEGEPANELPVEPLSLIVVRGESVGEITAEVIRKQLRSRGLEISIEVETMENVQLRWVRGDYDLVLSPLARGTRRFDAYTAGSYDSQAFQAAVANGDYELADEIVAHDAPATRLYEMKMFAAVDAKWCGDVTPRADSWRWIADLRPCKKGERP